jgi:hypothetical protein
MPQVVAAVAAFWAAYGTVITVVAVAISVAYSAYMMASMETPNYGSNELTDRSQTIRSSVQPHRMIYGEVVVGGVLVFGISHGENNKYVSLVVALAGHEVEEIGDVYLGDRLSTDARFKTVVPATPEEGYWVNTNWQSMDWTRTVITAPRWVVTKPAQPETMKDFVTVRKYTGTQTQEADAALCAIPATPTVVKSSYNGTGNDDMTAGGTYTGRGGDVYTIEITAGGTPDTFRWNKGVRNINGTITPGTWVTGVAITGADQTLSDGVTVKFADTTGHIVGDQWTVSAFNSQWTTAHRLLGIAYIVVTLEYDQQKFPNGLPNIKARVKGNNQIYDPATGLIGYTNNWALCVRDYLTKPYGLNCSDSEIHAATLLAARNICNESVTLANGGTQPRYVMNGSWTLDKKPVDVMKEMLTAAAAGYPPWSQGQYRIYPAYYVAPDATFHGMNASVPGLTESDLRDKLTIRPIPSRTTRFNAVKGTYVDPFRNWQESDFPIVTNATYEAIDGERITQDLTLPYTTDPVMAQRLAKIILEKGRQGITVDFPAKWSAFPLVAEDTVPVTIAQLGWNQKEFKVVGWKLAKEGGVDLTLQEESSTCYDWNSGEETTIDPAPNTMLPDPWTVDAPQGLTAVETLYVTNDVKAVKSKVRFSWAAVGGVNEYNVLVNGVFYATVRGDVGIDIADMIPRLYVLGVAAVSNLGVQSAYTYLNVNVLGKTTPISDVSSFLINGSTLSWSEVSDIDLIGYQIRYHVGRRYSWGDAIPLHSGLLQASPYTLQVLPPGQVTIMICARDSGGKFSRNPAYIVTNIGYPIVKNIVFTTNLAALGWPTGGMTMWSAADGVPMWQIADGELMWKSTLVDGAVNGGQLEATDLSDAMWNPEDEASMWLSDGNPMWPGTRYADMHYRFTVGVTAEEIGGRLLLNYTAQGNRIAVNYRQQGSGPMWSAQTEDRMWSEDDTTALWNVPDFLPWPGEVVAAADDYDFEIMTGFGATQGIISALSVVVDVPDITETLSDVAIGAGGTRLPITKTYRVIKNVNLTMQSDGGTGRTVEVIDKDPDAGPLVKSFDSSHLQTTGIVDAIVQGY